MHQYEVRHRGKRWMLVLFRHRRRAEVRGRVEHQRLADHHLRIIDEEWVCILMVGMSRLQKYVQK